jgi:hypothetical protein
MEKEAMIALLQQNYAQLIEQVSQLNDRALLHAPSEKWNALQQVDHLIKSVAPVNMAFGLPAFILSWRFGLANRPSRTYDALVDRYHIKLQAGGRASGPFVPPPVIAATEKERLLQQLDKLTSQLVRRTNKYKEFALDKYILPHPLLGMITLREMIYFTAYHASHHGKSIQHGLISLA